MQHHQAPAGRCRTSSLSRASIVLLPGLLLLALGPIVRAQDPGPGQKVLDPETDARLRQHVRLRSKAAPVGTVLQALKEKTGITFETEGRAGDEPFVAFVPDAPVA